MNKFLIVVTLFSLFVSCDGNKTSMSQELRVSPSSFGRVDPKTGWMAFPGTKSRICFSGSCKVGVEIEEQPFNSETDCDCIYLIRDEKDTVKCQLTKGKNMYEVGFFGAGLHSVEVIKLTESQVGKMRVASFVVDSMGVDFTVMESEYVSDYTIEFIGNSITCGYGNEDTTNIVGFHAIHQNVMKTYAALVAEHYSADAYFTAYSGRGLARNYGGSTEGLMPEFYERWMPDEVDARIEEGAFLPVDMIVVNIGTNDMNSEITTGTPLDTTLFVKRYVDFISRIRQIHGNVPVICTVGPMLNDGYPQGGRFLSRCVDYVKEVVSISNRNSGNVYFFAYAPQTAPFGEDFHPSAITHRRMADELIAFIDSNVISEK